MLTATLQDAILGTMGTRPKHDWNLQELIGLVGRSAVVTANDQREWGGQPNLSHRVRSELAKLKNAGLVQRVRRATYRLV